MAKKTSKRAKSPADELEANIRSNFLPAQLAEALTTILQIELNAKWRATPEGKHDAIDREGYDETQLSEVLEKQDATRVRLLPKVEFLKRLYNQQEKHV